MTQTDRNSQPLAGKLAIVTGAGRGIGRAASLTLAELGAKVVLLARDGKELEALQTAIEGEQGAATPYPLDVRDVQAVQRFGAWLRDEHGRADVLVNNAGAYPAHKPLHELEPADWDKTMETNLRGPYLMIRAVAPLMIEARGGHIINISSLAGHNALPGGAVYAASKSGLNGLTYSVAEDLRPYNIRVSVIAPGSVNTGFGGQDPSKDERAARKIQPEDVAQVIAMLVQQAPQSFVSEVLLRPTSKK